MAKMDQQFLNLALDSLAEVAITQASKSGASYCDFRLEKIRHQSASLRDTHLENLITNDSIGIAVRVIANGAWGFAATDELTPAACAKVASLAVTQAKLLAKYQSEPVQLAPEPAWRDEYISDYTTNPFDVRDQDKTEWFKTINEAVLKTKQVEHVTFHAQMVQENKFFASSEGSRLTSQRIRSEGNFEALKIDPSGQFETMRSGAVPSGKGWEYLANEYDFLVDATNIPDLLCQKISSPTVIPGKYDLVIDPSNLFLTIHESVGHATELDRALGYEANYAGTSFATPEKLNKLSYGSDLMNITGDRLTPGGLSTVGYDDEGVKAQSWDIVKNGQFVGYQLNRQMAANGFGRSNGCAFADSPFHQPLQRMPNVSLKPNPNKCSLQDLISGVDNGIYIVGDKSWSIDMQRYNFQFTGQRFYKIKNGKLQGQLKDVAYQATTTDFWNSLAGLGDETTYLLGGAFNCGKGQPSQVAPVSHGCPAARFDAINVLNTTKELGK